MSQTKAIAVVRPDAKENLGRQKFLEAYAEPVVLNSYLKLAVLILAAVVVGLIFIVFRTDEALRSAKPLIIRVNDVGRAEAVNYSDLSYHPQEADNRYFLSQWAQLFYSRNRFTVQQDFTKALQFLNGDVQGAIIEQSRKSKTLETFLTDPAAPNIDVEIKNVSIEDLRKPPYRARIEFLKIYSSPIDQAELKRELWTANVVYVFRDQVPNDMLLVNPLGLTITYFRQDQAFEQEAK